MSSVASVEVLSFQVPFKSRAWDCDGLPECTVVRITDVDGRSGIGEVGAPAAAVEALLRTTETQDYRHTLTDLLLGQDPLETTALWDRMFAAIQTVGRRGLGNEP